MLGGPCCVSGLGVLGQCVVPHEHEANVEVRVRLFDGQHLTPVGRFEETLRFDDHTVGQEEVGGVFRAGDILELLHLIEVGASDLVQVFTQPFLQS